MEINSTFTDQTIAQYLEAHGGSVKFRDANGKETYYQNAEGWWKKEYDAEGNEISLVRSNGRWWKYEYDADCNATRCDSYDGKWWKKEFDALGTPIYCEYSDEGIIYDKRPK
jgi:YD repeat-containing protein